MYSFLLSLFGLFTLAMERLWCLWKPLQHRSLFSTQVLFITLLVIWIMPLPVLMINLIWALGHASYGSYAGYIWTFMALIMLVSLSTLCTYITTFYQIRKIIRGRYNCSAVADSENGIHTGGSEETRKKLYLKKQVRPAQLGSALLLCYVISYFPTLYENVMVYQQKLELLNGAVCNFATYSHVLNALINPLLCLIMKEDYRKALKSLLRIKNQRDSELSAKTDN